MSGPKDSAQSTAHHMMLRALAGCTLAFGLMQCATHAVANTLVFASTSDASSWQVSTQAGGLEGAFSSFSAANFAPAVTVSGRTTDGIDWISNNASGSNACCVGNGTFFIFRQTFNLTNAEAGSAVLTFQWAADDSGEGFAARGTWTPKFSVNSGSLVNGVWATGAT